MIFCQTLGPPIVRLQDGSTPRELQWQKNLALLVYLARSPRRARTRDHLVALLWGDKPGEKARASLNEALRTLRASGVPVESNGAHIALGANAVALDVDELERHADAGELEAAAALINGLFCEGTVIADAPRFDDWLSAEQKYWQRRSVDVLVRHSTGALASGELDVAIAAAHHAAQLDPYSESAVQSELRALTLAAKQGEALAVFAAFAERVKREDDRAPDATTTALAQRIRDQREWHLAVAETPAAPLVGRHAELGQLVEAWERSRAGHVAVAIVEGDGGTGKSRLADELAGRARLDGATVLALRAVEGDQADAWSGVLAMARGGLLEARGIASVAPALLAELRDEKGVRSPRALAEALAAVADEQPILLLVDDAHWLDRESLLALGVCARDLTQARVMLLLTVSPVSRRAELDEIRAHIGREIPGAALVLEPLRVDDLRELGRWAFPSYSTVQLERLARRILADSAGIPLLATELLRALAAGLDDRQVRREWPEPLRTLDQTFPADLPDVIRAALRVNYQGLAADARKLLVVAAVLDGRSSAALLSHVSDVAGDSLAAALDELEWHRWLAFESRGYSIVARIVRDVIIQDMVTRGERERIVAAAAAFRGRATL